MSPSDLVRLCEAPPEAIPALLGELERVKAALWARLMAPAVPPTTSAADGLLDAEEVATLLRVPKGYVYEMARPAASPARRSGATCASLPPTSLPG